MGLEDREFENWKVWAKKEVELLQQRQAAMYTAFDEEGVREEGGEGEGEEREA